MKLRYPSDECSLMPLDEAMYSTTALRAPNLADRASVDELALRGGEERSSFPSR